MTYYEELARAKMAEVRRDAADPALLMAHELRLVRRSRRRPRRAR